MTNSPSLLAYTLSLKKQRDEYRLREAFTEQPKPPTSAWARFCNWFSASYEEPVAPTPIRTAPPARTFTPMPAPVDNRAALATQNKVNELQSVIAGQSAELAQLRQAVLVLAKSARSVESNTLAIVDDMQVVLAQTSEKITPWETIETQMSKCWRDIIDDTLFLQDGVAWISVGRTARSIFSLGTAAPEAVKAAKREVFAHIKAVRSYRDKLETCYQYAQLHHKAQVDKWVAAQTSTLKANKSSWTFLDVFKPSFLEELKSALNGSRGI